MKTCKTCKYWAELWYHPSTDEGMGECSGLPDYDGFDLEIEGDWSKFTIETANKFGCTSHEERETGVNG